MDKILKVAKRLKTFTLDDIVMFCEIDPTIAERFLQRSETVPVTFPGFLLLVCDFIIA